MTTLVFQGGCCHLKQIVSPLAGYPLNPMIGDGTASPECLEQQTRYPLVNGDDLTTFAYQFTVAGIQYILGFAVDFGYLTCSVHHDQTTANILKDALILDGVARHFVQHANELLLIRYVSMEHDGAESEYYHQYRLGDVNVIGETYACILREEPCAEGENCQNEDYRNGVVVKWYGEEFPTP